MKPNKVELLPLVDKVANNLRIENFPDEPSRLPNLS